jgi:hypothetical protein
MPQRLQCPRTFLDQFILQVKTLRPEHREGPLQILEPLVFVEVLGELSFHLPNVAR